MNLSTFAIQQLGTSMYLWETFTADLSEDDARFVPCAGGVHVKWMLMHVATSEDWIISKLTDGPLQLSEEHHKHYRGGSTCRVDDPMTLADCMQVFKDTRARVVACLSDLPEARYDAPSPAGTPDRFPTIASLVSLLGFHPLWHFGQLTVNRRMLGKPQLM